MADTARHVRTQAWAQWHRASESFSIDCTCGERGALWRTEWEAKQQFDQHVAAAGAERG